MQTAHNHLRTHQYDTHREGKGGLRIHPFGKVAEHQRKQHKEQRPRVSLDLKVVEEHQQPPQNGPKTHPVADIQKFSLRLLPHAVQLETFDRIVRFLPLNLIVIIEGVCQNRP